MEFRGPKALVNLHGRRLTFRNPIGEGLPVTRQGSLAVRKGSRNGHTAILAPRSSRFQKPEGVASESARSARLRIATR